MMITEFNQEDMTNPIYSAGIRQAGMARMIALKGAMESGSIAITTS